MTTRSCTECPIEHVNARHSEEVAKLRATLKAYEIALAGIPDSYADEVNRRVANLVEDV